MSASDSEAAMLLSGKVGQAYVQRAWREYCAHTGQPVSPAVESISTTSRWLAGNLATLVITPPPPRAAGEAHLALLTLPAGGHEGPRRYFTLETTGDDSPTPATALYEWTKAPAAPSGFSGRLLANAIEPTVDSLATAVEKLAKTPSPAASDAVPKKTASSRPWWKFWG
jgi:hypothetical protein